MKMSAFLACCLLAGCGYDPPVKADHSSEKYQADLLKCWKQVEIPAERIANATVGSSLQSIFKSDEPERRDMRTCMQGKGYRLE